MKKYGICLTTFNRFDYLTQTINSLFASNILDNTKIFISDDASEDKNVKNLLNKIQEKQIYPINPTVEIEIFYNETNIGSRLHYMKNIGRFKNENVDIIINIDSDSIFNKDWMIKLDELLHYFNYNVVANVFFCDNRSRDPNNFVIEHENYIERNALHGIGITFPSFFAPLIESEIIEGDHLDHYLSRKAKELGLKLVSSKESYIEHIGEHGVHTNPWCIDKATNFIK